MIQNSIIYIYEVLGGAMHKKKIKQENIESGRRVKGIRELRGKTQEEFAEELSISTSALKKIESGENGVSNNILRRLIKMDVSSDYILEGKRQNLEKLLYEVENSTAEDKISLLIKLIVECAGWDKKGELSAAQILRMIELALDGNTKDEKSINS